MSSAAVHPHPHTHTQPAGTPRHAAPRHTPWNRGLQRTTQWWPNRPNAPTATQRGLTLRLLRLPRQLPLVRAGVLQPAATATAVRPRPRCHVSVLAVLLVVAQSPRGVQRGVLARLGAGGRSLGGGAGADLRWAARNDVYGVSDGAWEACWCDLLH